MFNVRPERLIPWLYVEPPPADEVPGFRMNADGSVRDTQRSTPFGSFGFGTLSGTLTPRHPEAAQTLAQPALAGLTPSPDFLAQPPLPNGLAQFRSGRQDDVPGFNFRLLEDIVPALNFVEGESSPLRHVTPWPDRAFPTPSDYPDSAPAPPGVEELTHLAQLPAWLATVPVPRLSTAFDPRTGRRIVPNEPLIGPIRRYLAADEHSRGTEDIRPDVAGPLPDLDSAEASGAEQWPSFDLPAWPADINTDPSATTAQHANPEFSPETMKGNAWPQRPMNGRPHTEAGGLELGVPQSVVMMPQPGGFAPSPPAGPVADPNFVLSNAGDAEEQTEQRIPLPQSQPTELKAPVTQTGSAARPPEHRSEQALSRSMEDHRQATAAQIEELVGTIATFGSRIYEDSILKAKDDLVRLAERLRNDPSATVQSILNSFPPTRVGGKVVGGLAAVLTILANAKRGLDFERAVLHALNAASPTTKINKNTGKISVEGIGRSIPDVLQKGIREIKSGVEIDNSVQLRVQAAYAKLFGVPFSLIVSPTTKRISQEVRKRVQETGGTIQRFDPATGVFTPF